jgi:hypothetical protein
MEQFSVEGCVRFVPSRVEGLPDVTEVAIYPDRLELLSAGHLKTILYEDLAERPRPRWWWRFTARWARRGGTYIGERDWFHLPVERFVRFFTSPPLVIYMPDETGVAYGSTVFCRMHLVMAAGGYGTYDLG